jgi:hypothetical protein
VQHHQNLFESKSDIRTEEQVEGTDLKRKRRREGGRGKNYRVWRAVREKREGNKDVNGIKEIKPELNCSRVIGG